MSGCSVVACLLLGCLVVLLFCCFDLVLSRSPFLAIYNVVRLAGALLTRSRKRNGSGISNGSGSCKRSSNSSRDRIRHRSRSRSSGCNSGSRKADARLRLRGPRLLKRDEGREGSRGHGLKVLHVQDEGLWLLVEELIQSHPHLRLLVLHEDLNVVGAVRSRRWPRASR